jgi:hypothetical protein
MLARKALGYAVLGFVLLGVPLAAVAQSKGFVATVESLKPIAYYRLDATSGSSVVGSTTFTSAGGATSATPGAPIGAAGNGYVQFNGVDGMITTTQLGGVGSAASIMAWVKLSALPSKTGRIVYVAGESQGGNDLDLQFEADNTLKFYTAGGDHTTYVPAADLVGKWHMIVATMNCGAGSRAIYWDGKLAASDKTCGKAGKTNVFTIAESPVFTGRWFTGGIDEVALWNYALSGAQVAEIYGSSKVPAP